MKVLGKMGVLLSIICGLNTELNANYDDIAKQTQLPWDGLGTSISGLVTDRITKIFRQGFILTLYQNIRPTADKHVHFLLPFHFFCEMSLPC